MLPIPKDPNFQMPQTSEHEFFNPPEQEDETLLKTGAWNDSPDEISENVEDHDVDSIEELPTE